MLPAKSFPTTPILELQGWGFVFLASFVFESNGGNYEDADESLFSSLCPLPSTDRGCPEGIGKPAKKREL
jgi:hypothetical protein